MNVSHSFPVLLKQALSKTPFGSRSSLRPGPGPSGTEGHWPPSLIALECIEHQPGVLAKRDFDPWPPKKRIPQKGYFCLSKVTFCIFGPLLMDFLGVSFFFFLGPQADPRKATSIIVHSSCHSSTFGAQGWTGGANHVVPGNQTSV